ncbi:hypothetical protein G7Y89_g4757 [Cudoniella acicularis]|uniref:DUF924-domain-containing protein n=1 Tax=Cudoniella acicularis TaxID=354080 RepID=A0A8H4RNT2_9HELO|nr:hypothetical protein G7Y89_g4757 [Cudoniella acicularis]
MISLKALRPFNITSAFSKILSFQAAFTPTFQYQSPAFQFRAMSSLSSSKSDIDRVITYWFGNGEDAAPMEKWFHGGPEVDAEIQDQFAELVDQARASKLSSWTEEPKGTLALVILLDQFSRNLFRGSPLSYSAGPLALDISTTAIAKGFERQLTYQQQSFFYLPLVHDENLISQIAATALCEALEHRIENGTEAHNFARISKVMAERHRDAILRFGRFPGRNEALGRVSTPEEIEFLKKHPAGF